MESEIINPVQPASFAPRAEGDDPRFVLSPEDIPNVDDLVIEDGKPVDNMFVEKEYRLLTEPLYSSWASPSGEFVALANVGLFYQRGQPALVPDMMLSLGVPASRDMRQRENRSYLLWIMGKPPDAVIEIVSDLRGGEETDKMEAYARLRVTYYIIHDPFDRLRHGTLRAFGLRDGVYQPIDPSWLPSVGLGLTFWDGPFEEQHEHWLRWCDRDGIVLPTGQEGREQEKQRAEQEKQRAEQEKQRAEQEKQRAEQADQRAEQEKQRAEQADQRAEQEKQRAEQEKQRAEQEKQRAEQEKQRAERMAAQLRALGIEPEA